MEDRNGRIEFDPIFTIGIIGKCKIETIQEIKDFFSKLEEFETIYIKTTGINLFLYFHLTSLTSDCLTSVNYKLHNTH